MSQRRVVAGIAGTALVADPRAKARGTDLLNRYLATVMAVAAEDRTVNVALSRVQQMLAPPATLLHPAILRRAATGGRHLRGRAGSAATAGLTARSRSAA